MNLFKNLLLLLRKEQNRVFDDDLMTMSHLDS